MNYLISLIIGGLAMTSTQTPVATNYAAQTDYKTQDRIDQTFDLNPNGRVSLSNINGAVKILTWNDAKVKLEAVKTINCDKPQTIDVKIDAKADYLRVETEYEKNYGRYGNSGSYNRCKDLRVDYVLTVPSSARLDAIETVNGNIEVSGSTEFAKISTVNGKIEAREMSGNVNLSAVNGTLDADFAELKQGTNINISTVNGTSNVVLPSDADATISVSTVNGSIQNDFGLPVKIGEYVGRNMNAKLGNGNVSIRLSDVNGSINIKRRNDGRQVKPVTNLLRQDRETSGIGTVPPIPPIPPDAINNISYDAMRIASLELARAQMELERSNVNSKNFEKMQRDLEKMQRDFEKQYGKDYEEKLQREIEANVEKSFGKDFQDKIEASVNDSFGNGGSRLRERKTETFAVSGIANVKIEARNGSVTVRGSDKPEITYTLVSRKNDANQTSVQAVKNGASDLSLKIKDANEFRLEVFVPRKSNLQIITNKQIRVEGVTGDLKMEGTDETVDVLDSNGKLNVSTNDGKIRVIGFDGETTVKTVDGDISLEGNFSKLTTETVDGRTFLTVRDNISATVLSNAEDVSFDGFEPLTANKTENYSVWQIGSGDISKNVKFDLKSVDSSIVIRNANQIQVK
ncbi:MAG: hypothetical protein H7Z37_01345 [Pyrinomonadaceae bacterium]|nr:hypothetical protein [Pyrinomonadaceae bacterium]